MDEIDEGFKILALAMGQENAKAWGNFQNDLKSIEVKNIDFFKGRPARHESEPHDLLKYHYIMWQDQREIIFAFNKESDLPHEIREECHKAFKNRFGNIK